MSASAAVAALAALVMLTIWALVLNVDDFPIPTGTWEASNAAE